MTMKLEELRLNNFIHSPAKNCLFPKGDFQLTPGTFKYILEYGVQDLKPIPLTEEILLSLDFRKVNGYGFNLNGIRLIKCKYDNSFEFTEFRSKPIYLNYLHELQNFYFVLHQKELQINKHLYKKNLTPCDICGGTKLHSFNCEKTTNLK